MPQCEPKRGLGAYVYSETDPVFLAWLATLPFLKLDQTTPQTVVNGAPKFHEALKVKENKWIYLDDL